jgi:hypothetical protein
MALVVTVNRCGLCSSDLKCVIRDSCCKEWKATEKSGCFMQYPAGIPIMVHAPHMLRLGQCNLRAFRTVQLAPNHRGFSCSDGCIV